MRKFLLLGTIFVATSVWAFSGIGIGSLQRHKSKSGVDAIGVHIDSSGKKANVDVRSCDSETEELVGSECCKKTLIYTDNDTTKCCSTEGYAVQDGKCKKQCGLGWTLNEETNDCECPEKWHELNEETGECVETCAANRQCGDYCCGAGNICVDGNKCCDKDYDGDEEQCCNASETNGYSNDWGECCASEWTLLYHGGDWNRGTTSCGPITHFEDGCAQGETILLHYKQGYYCCPPGSTAINDDGECI